MFRKINGLRHLSLFFWAPPMCTIRRKFSYQCRKVLISAFGLICINPLMPVMDAQAQESLQQAWDIALQRDHGILAARFQEQAAQAQQDAAKLKSDQWRDKVADSIVDAVENYFASNLIASTIWSSSAEPPTSKKLAGLPP